MSSAARTWEVEVDENRFVTIGPVPVGWRYCVDRFPDGGIVLTPMHDPLETADEIVVAVKA